MPAIARLAAVALDAEDLPELSTFYRKLLDLNTFFESEKFIALKGAGILLTLQQVEEHQPPDWPTGAVPKQMHLELAVDDLDTAESAAVAVGARKAETQPSPDSWRVLLDPAGHPFASPL